MKHFKTFLLLILVLCMVCSLFSACKPADEDEDIIANNPGASIPNTQNDPTQSTPEGDTDSPVTENTPGATDTDTPGATPGQSGSNPSGTTNGDTPNTESNTTTPSAGGLTGNPLMKPGKTYNNGAAVSFDIDKTGFTKSGSLADLNGKTLTLFTGVDYAMFGYNNTSGKYLGEWEWFKELKRLYGVTIKYNRCSSGSNAVLKPFQAMSAGKDCDLITTHVGSFPYICNILAPLDQYCNMDKLTSSPGLDPMITQQTTWKNKPIVLGPCLANGVFNYNRTFIKNQGLDDPYTLFKAGKWNWTAFSKYMTALPDTDPQGKTVYGCSTWSQFWYWANTNGKACFEINHTDPNGGIVNNWDSAEVKETFVWLENVCDAGGNYLDGNAGNSLVGTDKTRLTVMCYGVAGVDKTGLVDESKGNEFFWVPFPKNEKNAKAVNHVEVYGYGIGIPRKTNKEQNRVAAVKFCELWCNRYTEARFDFLMHLAKWSTDQVNELYNFGTTNGRFGLGSGVGKLASIANNTTTNFNRSVYDKSFSVSTCMAKLSNLAKTEIENVIKFGVQ